jgi:hypothetical protein
MNRVSCGCAPKVVPEVQTATLCVASFADPAVFERNNKGTYAKIDVDQLTQQQC